VLHAWWVQPDRLLAAEYPASLEPTQTAAKIRFLIDAGIGAIVDLTDDQDHLLPYVETLHVEADRAGRTAQHFAHPIPDLDVTSDAGYDAILERIRDELEAGQKVYVHCW
jgi:protein-tyrosine phosphatase